MRLGALNGLVALAILLFADQPPFLVGQAALVRMGAQVQFMHGMATLACATFMNVGAKQARLAPAFFFGGIVLYCLPIYVHALGLSANMALLKTSGIAAFGMGWSILAWAARDIDKD